jgi:hypothetical protein
MKQNGILISYVIGLVIVISFVSLRVCNGQDPQKIRPPVPDKKVMEADNFRDYDLRERCGTYCINYFLKIYRDKSKEKSDNYSVSIDYVNHYNRNMNKCLMLVKSQSVPKKKQGPVITAEYLIDVHESKTIGEFIVSHKENVIDGQQSKTIKEFTITGKEDIISECKVDDKKCKSKDEWEKLMKPYMEG